jgi:3-oxoacyl-[acyl-carrier protein] reductase
MNCRFDFSGRTVVVTGAAQGIGRALAMAFLEAGANVVPSDQNADALRDSWAGTAALPTPCDVADATQVAALLEEAKAWNGSVDVVVNNAGITRDTISWKMADEQWRLVLDVHLTGTFNMTRAAIPYMRDAGWGRIVNVTSYTGLHGNIGQSNYAAAKAGIIGFTKTIAKEVARFGITVNAISPNAETAMIDVVPDEKKAELVAMTPLGRFGTAAEMAPAVEFLASDEAAYVTGIVLPVDGGLSM